MKYITYQEFVDNYERYMDEAHQGYPICVRREKDNTGIVLLSVHMRKMLESAGNAITRHRIDVLEERLCAIEARHRQALKWLEPSKMADKLTKPTSE